MTFGIQVCASDVYATAVARIISENLPESGSFVLTGGTTAAIVYGFLRHVAPPGAGDLDVLFSDERCVPADDAASNFRMASRLLLEPLGAGRVHRMRGEDAPEAGAEAYHQEIAPFVDRGLDLMLLGMGADAHIGAMFPGSPALSETERLCAAVERPDGMRGLTLTPPAMLAAKKVLLLVTGEKKASAVARVVEGNERALDCPARLLAPHPDTTFLLDEPAASTL